jgi:hypothetical protein
MPPVVPPNKVILLFRSMAVLSQFKKECTCADFYIDRDALTVVGSFTKEQIAIAMEKYNARPFTREI